MWIVVVKQKESEVEFGFNKMTDAMDFISICLECGNEGTEINIKTQEEE